MLSNQKNFLNIFTMFKEIKDKIETFSQESETKQSISILKNYYSNSINEKILDAEKCVIKLIYYGFKTRPIVHRG